MEFLWNEIISFQFWFWNFIFHRYFLLSIVDWQTSTFFRIIFLYAPSWLGCSVAFISHYPSFPREYWLWVENCGIHVVHYLLYLYFLLFLLMRLLFKNFFGLVWTQVQTFTIFVCFWSIMFCKMKDSSCLQKKQLMVSFSFVVDCI